MTCVAARCFFLRATKGMEDVVDGRIAVPVHEQLATGLVMTEHLLRKCLAIRTRKASVARVAMEWCAVGLPLVTRIALDRAVGERLDAADLHLLALEIDRIESGHARRQGHHANGEVTCLRRRFEGLDAVGTAPHRRWPSSPRAMRRAR